MDVDAKRLAIVSNRLPIAIEARGSQRVVRRGSGGLVTALSPVLQDLGGRWIGWLGHHDIEGVDALLADASSELGFRVAGVPLGPDEVKGYYEGFSNEVLWPLFHDFVPHCRFEPGYFQAYERVNHKFARVVADTTAPGEYLWIHDYHLMLVGRELDRLGSRRRRGFFLHIPFPSPDVFAKLPWRQQLIEGMLCHDLLGFQTAGDATNFIDSVARWRPDARIDRSSELCRIDAGARKVRVGAFPISIDFEDFRRRSVDDRVSELVAAMRARLPGRKIVLGLDRLDYSKGIPDRLRAFELAIEREPALRGKVTLLQIVVPSRECVDQYQNLKGEIDRLVGAINGRFARPGWVPIEYMFRHLDDMELLAAYRFADAALVTPLRDGMNLVAKEYCACSLEDDGVLVLSEFAGAAAQLSSDAIVVNPFDIEATARAIASAVTMSDEERRRRMHKLRESIRQDNIFRWVDSFLAAAESGSAAIEDGRKVELGRKAANTVAPALA